MMKQFRFLKVSDRPREKGSDKQNNRRNGKKMCKARYHGNLGCVFGIYLHFSCFNISPNEHTTAW